MNPFQPGTPEHDAWERQDAESPFELNGARLLDAVKAFLGRFIAYPSEHAHIAHTLWIVHTHLMEAWESTPRIAFLSPEPGSGKTRALEVSELLTPNPVEAVNVTPAYLFRKVGEQAPTILYDEVDTVFGPKAKENEEIRGLLNAGHRKGAVAGRCVVRGKIVETEEIPAYCAVALAGLGEVPDTLLSRSVVVKMRRRAPNEHVVPYRRRVHEAEGHELRDQISGWAEAIAIEMRDAWPDMPAGIEDRDADVWEPLLAIADVAGHQWPETARVAAVALVADSRESTPSLGVRLLADLRSVFNGHQTMSSTDVVDNLVNLDEAPWGDLRGKPLDARSLAGRLRRYEVKSVDMRIGDWHGKGYRKEDLQDAWSRYLPTSTVADVADAVADVAEQKSSTTCDVADVADVADPWGNGEGLTEFGSPTRVRANENHTKREEADKKADNEGGKGDRPPAQPHKSATSATSATEDQCATCGEPVGPGQCYCSQSCANSDPQDPICLNCKEAVSSGWHGQNCLGDTA